MLWEHAVAGSIPVFPTMIYYIFIGVLFVIFLYLSVKEEEITFSEKDRPKWKNPFKRDTDA